MPDISLGFRLRSAWRSARQRFSRPLLRLHSTDRGDNDHAHVCLAARLLEEDDFCHYCPKHGAVFPEADDACEECPYLIIVDFNIHLDLGGIAYENV